MTDSSQQELLAAVLSHYDIGALRGAERHGGTAAGNWRIETARGVWLLRTRGARTSTEDAIAFDHALRRHLVGQGVPTAAPVAGRDGQTAIRLADRAFEVYPVIPGRSCTRASDAQLQSAARGLVALERTDVESALALADGLRAAGRPGEAEQVYQVALGADVEDPRVHVGLAALALAAGRREEATREADLAWELLSDGGSSLPVAERGRAWQGLADIFAALGDEERAQQAGVRARGLLRAIGAGDEAEESP